MKYCVSRTLFPPEYSKASSSAPVDDPSWSLSLLLLNRLGRLGPLRSCRSKKNHSAVSMQVGEYLIIIKSSICCFISCCNRSFFTVGFLKAFNSNLFFFLKKRCFDTLLDLLMSVSERLFWVLLRKSEALLPQWTLSRPSLTSVWELDVSPGGKKQHRRFARLEVVDLLVSLKKYLWSFGKIYI